MKNSLKVSKKNILQKRTFTPKLTADDTIAFAFLAAERGLTPDKLIESFVRDIVSSFSADEITVEEKHLFDWFNGSWFSQDNDKCFSFLQYIIRNKCYEDVIAARSEFAVYYLEIAKRKNVEINKKLESEQSEKILNCFKSYCIENPAHKSFKEEWEIIKNFYNYIDKLLKGGNNKWLL